MMEYDGILHVDFFQIGQGFRGSRLHCERWLPLLRPGKKERAEQRCGQQNCFPRKDHIRILLYLTG